MEAIGAALQANPTSHQVVFDSAAPAVLQLLATTFEKRCVAAAGDSFLSHVCAISEFDGRLCEAAGKAIASWLAVEGEVPERMAVALLGQGGRKMLDDACARFALDGCFLGVCTILQVRSLE